MSGKKTPLYLVYPGTALGSPAYRIVLRCPPTVEDFRSYESLGRRYDRRDFFRATGVSMLTSQDRAVALARRFGLGRGVAVLDLEDEAILWVASGWRDHITVWAPAGVLLERVVQCEEHG